MRRSFVLLLLLGACRREAVEQTTQAIRQPAIAPDLDPSGEAVRVRLRAAELEAGSGPFRYAYEGTVPGPTIRARVGDLLEVELENALRAPTTVHWHGLQVPWEMDGVTWMREPVMPGATATYRFRLGRAGTYWYHPHFDADGQVDGGLYGVLVVEDPAEPTADEELVLVFDTAGEVHRPSAAFGHGRRQVRWLVNGQVDPVHEARAGTVLRARLVNASNVDYLAIRWPGIRQIGSDQGLLPSLVSPARLLLAPGDRVDVEILLGSDGVVVLADAYSLNGGDAFGDTQDVMTIVPQSSAPAPSGLAWPFVAEPSAADPGYADIVYAFSGSDRSGRWLINGEAFPNVTIEEASLGSTRIIELRNLSPTEHPFHLHGMPFEVVSTNGVPPTHRTVEDTHNLKIGDRVRVRVQANNPGDWMAHCHIFPHAHEGMMTVFRVRP